MGIWNAGLYDDDNAADLKTTLALVCKVPGDGDRLLNIVSEATGAKSDDGEDAWYWLVLADQFEKRGLASERVRARALALIEGGADLAHARANGADDTYLNKRAAVLAELGARIRAPRPLKPVKKAGKPPELVLQTGQVYAFPTMDGRAWTPYRPANAAPFAPDGWGALVVLDTGRAFGWLPWVALASLTVDPGRKPTLEQAVQGRLIPHLQTQGAGRYVPKRAHAAGLGLELLGEVRLDPRKVAPHLSTLPVAAAIALDWTICYGALRPETRNVPVECELASLLAQ
ncbi:MAG TPA: hypothetical protein VFS95_13400 [Telluria sp.]|nr:hypothetical protein [Telluria sp.]